MAKLNASGQQKGLQLGAQLLRRGRLQLKLVQCPMGEGGFVELQHMSLPVELPPQICESTKAHQICEPTLPAAVLNELQLQAKKALGSDTKARAAAGSGSSSSASEARLTPSCMTGFPLTVSMARLSWS
eukprot:CAMPEP_0117654382 /NCGR_PEP_ID=MMETSP0804-20121206/3713_1 /TAXON_ID=1074897 /ORGANISM="Tetraselmis astigmatica, Strain CCMP880" /LENGTH=128 /DNA_ID=CAMNT_0005460657 /DNA_START=27 /DNA_END=414 /DNA_ORIENTATION=-